MRVFEHGGDITAFAKACSCRVDEVIDLSSNINFVKPKIDLDFNTLDIAPYPNYDKLYQAVASHYGVTVEELELFNGGSSAIFKLFDSLQEIQRCIIYSPAYLEYKRAVEVFGYEIQNIDRFSDIDAEITEGSLVIFVNPSTPDGIFYDIESLLQKWQERDCTVLIDESFIEFTSHSSVTHYLDRYPNLYILKSMTKFFGAAGIRIGTLISQRENIIRLQSREPLWKLSAFDSAYIQTVLEDQEFKERSDTEHTKSRAYLLEILKNSQIVKSIYPSVANYILIELDGIRAKELQRELLPYRVMVRSCENFDGLGEYHLRIAVKSIDELSQLKEIFSA